MEGRIKAWNGVCKQPDVSPHTVIKDMGEIQTPLTVDSLVAKTNAASHGKVPKVCLEV